MVLEPWPDDDTVKTKVIVRNLSITSELKNDDGDTNCFIFKVADGNVNKQMLKIIDGDIIVNTITDNDILDSVLFGTHDKNGEQIIAELRKNPDVDGFKFECDFIIDSLYNTDSAFSNIDDKFVKNIKIESTNKENLIIIGDDGEFLTIEKEGEIIFINKQKHVDDICSDIDFITSDNGSNIIVIQTRITLDEVDKDEAETLKSKGIKTTKRVPDFDYLKFYPKSAENALQVKFKLSERDDVTLRILDMLGCEIFYEKIENFQGEYYKTIPLNNNKKGTYILQIVQGKQSITKKVIVE